MSVLLLTPSELGDRCILSSRSLIYCWNPICTLPMKSNGNHKEIHGLELKMQLSTSSEGVRRSADMQTRSIFVSLNDSCISTCSKHFNLLALQKNVKFFLWNTKKTLLSVIRWIITFSEIGSSEGHVSEYRLFLNSPIDLNPFLPFKLPLGLYEKKYGTCWKCC